MISAQSKFKLLDRGFQGTVVLIPGWATDYRLFDKLELNYNYLLPVEFNPFNFEERLLEFLNKNLIGRVSFFGWSLGGFLAVDFCSKFPGKIDELILLGIRRRYNLKLLQEIELKLQQNRKAYLYRFYQDCFSPADRQGRAWFKKHLLKDYLLSMDLEELLRGLDYLSCACLRPEALSKVRKIRIFHGASDKIAPFQEAQVIQSYLPQAEFVCLENFGHLFFLNPDFKTVFHG